MEEIDWNYWLVMKSVSTWDAALLSVNINPLRAYVDGFINEKANIVFYRNHVPEPEEQEAFAKRRSIIENNYDSDTYAYKNGQVDLVKFINWMKLKNQEMPDAMVEIATISLPLNKQYPKDWKELVKQQTLLYCKNRNKHDINEKAASAYMEGYLTALFDNRQITSIKKAGTIVKEVYSAEQWWAREVKVH